MKKISALFTYMFLVIAPVLFSMRNSIVTLDDSEDHTPSIQRLKLRTITLADNEKEIIDKALQINLENKEITPEQYINARNYLEKSSTSIEKLNHKELKRKAKQRLDKRGEERCGKFLNYLIGKPLRTACLGAQTVTTGFFGALGVASEALACRRILSSLIDSAELIPAFAHIKAVKIATGFHQLLTNPGVYFLNLSLSCTLIFLGELALVVSVGAYESDKILNTEIESIKKAEVYLNKMGLTWEQGEELKELEKNWYKQWDIRRSNKLTQLLENHPKCSNKKLKAALQNLTRKFIDEMEMPKLEEALHELDEKVIKEMNDAKTEFINSCKEKNQSK